MNININPPPPPQPGDTVYRCSTGTWYAEGLRDLRELHKGKRDLAGRKYADYTDEESSTLVKFYRDETLQHWKQWASYLPWHDPVCCQQGCGRKTTGDNPHVA